MFVPGGPGSRDTAEATFELWLSRGSTLGSLMSVHVALPGEGHILSPTADQERFFDFWTHH